MDRLDMGDFMTEEEVAEAEEILERMSLLARSPRGHSRGEHPRDTMIPMDELFGAMAGEPSFEGPGPNFLGLGLSSQGPGPNFLGPGLSSQGPGPNFLGPGPSSRGPGPRSQGSGPSRQGPGPSRQDPGPSRQGPGPNFQGPGPNLQGPGLSSQGPGLSSRGPGPNFQGPGPNLQDPGPSSRDPGPSSRGPGPSSQDLGFSDAVPAGDNFDPPEDWKKAGILNTVKPDDNDEIDRLRGLVDTRLHVAARAQDLTAICELLAADASPAALDWQGRTPLHFCVVYKLRKPFEVLLTAPGIADVRAADVRDASGLPLLHLALLHGWQDGVRAALAAGARVDATGLKKIDITDLSDLHYVNNRYPKIQLTWFLDSLPRTPIEVAMDHDMEMLEPILLVAMDMAGGVDSCLNTFGHTALHTAIWLHNPRAIKTLLRYGASPHKVSAEEDSALHAAIHHPDILKYFLDNTDVKSTLNKKGLAPEHEAILSQNSESLILLLDKFKTARVKTREEGNTPLHLAATKVGDEIAKVILKRENGVQAMFEVNEDGYTPLHLAANHNNKELAALLLLNGANLSTTTKRQLNDENEITELPKTVLELISTNFYDAVNFFERLFDGFIYNMDIGKDGKTAVHLDYKVLTNGEGMSQIKILEEFVKCDRSKVLIHPLIASLLYLKWKHFEPVFFALLCVYGIFLVFFNSLIVCIFYLEDTSNNTMNMNKSLNASPTSDTAAANSTGFHGGGYWLLIVLTYISIFTLALQESMFIYLKKWRHFRSVESWVKLIGLVVCTLTPPLAALAPEPWPRQAACAALLLVWVQAMFLVSRFSRWGYYVLMFGKVAVNILKILVTAVFLVIAFAFCFMIQYHSAPPFDDPFAAFVKTLVMMSSEFDYENLFDDKHDIHLQGTRWVVRILFVVFVIFVAIVLMNFMTGVAVSDINDLNKTGQIRRLEKQVELLSTFEPLAYDGVLAKWFIKLFGDKKYHSSMFTFRGNQSKWHVEIRKSPPNVVEDINSPPDAVEGTNSPPDAVEDTNSPPDAVEGTNSPPDAVEDTNSLPDAVEDTNGERTGRAPPHQACPTPPTPHEIAGPSSPPNTVGDSRDVSGRSDVAYTIQITSSKLYNAIVETPSKQQQQDQEAAKHNAEKPYRSQLNALNNDLAEKPAGAHRRGEDDDLIKGRANHFNSIIYKQRLSSLARDSSKMSRDIEVLKQLYEDLHIQIRNLSAISLNILNNQLEVAHAHGTAPAPPAPPRLAQEKPKTGG